MKKFQVTYSICNSKGYLGTRTEIMTEEELKELYIDWMYYTVEEVWEL